MRFRGTVEKGEQRGTRLGFPTINISMDEARGENARGIFAAKVFLGGTTYFAAAYVNASRNILEAHLLDFDDDLYGKEVEIELLEKIRDDEKFADEDALKAAIANDIAKVRKYFKN